MTHRTDNFGLMVVGDAMLDVVAEPESEYAGLEYVEVSMAFHAGGSGVNLALAARSMGFSPVWLICSLGASRDIANESIKADLEAAGISLIINSAVDSLTGITIIGYLHADSRLLLTAPGANRAPLSESVIAAACSVLPDVLVVSGYMLFRPSTREGALRIMQEAGKQGTVVVLDLVPHSLHKMITLAELYAFLDLTDVAAGAFSTFAAFGIDEEALLPHVEGVVAYRPDGAYRFVTRAGSKVDGEFRDHLQAALPRGMSERLIIRVLREYFLPTRT